MAATSLLAVRVTPEVKATFHALAQRDGLTESQLMKRLVDQFLLAAGDANAMPEESVEARCARLTVRLQADDRLLLHERATGRGMPMATYVSALVRAHLRTLAPLPNAEHQSLKRSITELSAIGRNLNQVVRRMNQGGLVNAPNREDVMAFLTVCEGLRDHTKALLHANTRSWITGQIDARG